MLGGFGTFGASGAFVASGEAADGSGEADGAGSEDEEGPEAFAAFETFLRLLSGSSDMFSAKLINTNLRKLGASTLCRCRSPREPPPRQFDFPQRDRRPGWCAFFVFP